MKYWIVPPVWSGEVAFILGCGPSLRHARIWNLKGQNVIAVNDSYRLAPWAPVLYFCDLRWWQINGAHVQEHFNGQWTVTLENQIEGVHALRNTGDFGLETDPGGLRNGSNSGYQAINLAYHLGAKTIFLVGFDMRVDGEEVHWRERSEREATATAQEATMRDVMLPKFPSLAEELAQRGVQVINCTPNSALETWAHQDLDQVLQTIS